MIHDPLCDWRPCTCPLDYDVPERGHMIGCPEDDCECEIIAKVRADERSRKGACWREAEGSQIPSGAVRVYREAGWFWEMP